MLTELFIIFERCSLILSSLDCPFRYQWQYDDEETGLYYNRFRYYSPETGSYLSQDPIGLAGNNPTLYGYVKDSNTWVDIYGLNVFWSGGKAAQKAAEEFAKNEGGIRTILETTDLGKAAAELADEASAKGIPWPKGGGVAFDMASEEFALNAVSDTKQDKKSLENRRVKITAQLFQLQIIMSDIFKQALKLFSQS